MDTSSSGGGAASTTAAAAELGVAAAPPPPSIADPPPFLPQNAYDPVDLHRTRYPSKRPRSSPLEPGLSSPLPPGLDSSSDRPFASPCDPQNGLPHPDTYDFHLPWPDAGEIFSFQKNCTSSRVSNDTGTSVAESPPASAASSHNMIRGKGTGSIFFKTKLCCKFRTGTCPYNSSCNFAHGTEELRKPPPGWEEMVAAQEAERAMRGGGQTQVLIEPTAAASGDNQRFQKTPRSCRKFYTEDGCPYGDRCIFMHDDQGSQVRALRESNAISLGPVSGQANGTIAPGGSAERSSNWKSRVCNKWETTGHCPFGQKCHFFHGASEPYSSVPNPVAARAAPGQAQRQVQKLMQLKWKGPADGISTIYGDWIEDDEWEIQSVNVVAG